MAMVVVGWPGDVRSGPEQLRAAHGLEEGG